MKSILNENLYKSRNIWIKNKSESFSHLFNNTLCLTSPNYILMPFFFSFSQIMLCFHTGNKILPIPLYLLFSLAVFSDLHKRGSESNTVKLFSRSLLSSNVTEFKSWISSRRLLLLIWAKEGRGGGGCIIIIILLLGPKQRWSRAPSPARRAEWHRGDPLPSPPRSV